VSKEAIKKQIFELVEKFSALHFAVKPFQAGASVIPPSGKVLGASELKNIEWVELLKYLDQYKIGTRQPYFEGSIYSTSGELTNTDKVMNDTFWSGVYPGLTEAMLDYEYTPSMRLRTE